MKKFLITVLLVLTILFAISSCTPASPSNVGAIRITDFYATNASITNLTVTTGGTVTGLTSASPTITGTVTGNATYTNPTIKTFSNNGTFTMPKDTTDTIVARGTTDTLTNKTLTAPIISTISNTATLTLPTTGGNVLTDNSSSTLTNKTLTGPSITNPTITGLANNFSFNGTSLTTVAAITHGFGSTPTVCFAGLSSAPTIGGSTNWTGTTGAPYFTFSSNSTTTNITMIPGCNVTQSIYYILVK
jgi:hypothetical protein